jgi:hypothetical protein
MSKPMTTQESCLNCRFSHPKLEGRTKQGQEPGPLWCRRYAPRPMQRLFDNDLAGETSTEWCWPTVFPENWCGEWAAMNSGKTLSWKAP